MGLFGILGKVAKAGLSVVTRGASDKIISGLKSVIGGKPKAAAQAVVKDLPPTLKESVLERAISGATPRVVRTESRSDGWGFGGRSKPAAKRKPKKKKLSAFLESAIAYGGPRVAMTPTRAPRARKARAVSPAKPRSPRKPPSGGLDLKAIGAAWAAAGKGPGTGMTWAQFRSANSHLRLK